MSKASSNPLTRAYNREYFGSALSNELERSRKLDGCTSLLLLDIDHFKRINDEYGHPAGDAVLVEFVRRIRTELGVADVLARYGGEEFAIIARGMSLSEAARVAESVRRAICDSPFDVGSASLDVTVSIGCASTSCCEENAPLSETLIAVADRRLYVAKDTGRNRVIVSDTEVTIPPPSGR
ncbi:MAG: GGDEF domain-containing protein [Polyangiaceae bacterium]